MQPNSTLTRVQGLLVGHQNLDHRPTGCTVIICPEGTIGGVDVRGAAPGTRETDVLAMQNSVEEVHAVLLAGGSAFGLDAATGVMRWLERQGRGIHVGPACVPIVPGAVIFDLGVGDPQIRPDADSGWAACEVASPAPVVLGNVGAGAGATVGKVFGPQLSMKGGIGSAALTVKGITVSAMVVVNALGDVINPHSGQILAGARKSALGLELQDTVASLIQGTSPAALTTGINTTIGVIATDAVLTKKQAHRLAQMGHNGLARTLRPAHTPWDGDTLFALGTGGSGKSADMMLLTTLAAEVTAMAVVSAVESAQELRWGTGWWPSMHNLN
ncbi:MAG: peptidase S58 family protein [Betaproteobacteria bacterium]|nr:peptidase S58 family protein [Betaproteobacteria bacterium]NBY06319.1 peptidase S58 family protein [Betaproteobacteria bacterium]